MINPSLAPLVAALAIAHSLLALDSPQLAAAVLGTHLYPMNPEDADADPVLIDAAILFAGTGRRMDWARYADRASRQLAGDLQQTARARAVLGALERGEAAIPVPDADTDLGGADTYQRARQCLGRFDTAQQLHRRGSCGEAVRAGAGALDDFLHHHRAVFPGLTTPMITRFAAMLSACRRDTEARQLFAEHAAHLPPAGTPARQEFAVITLRGMDLFDQRHAPQCVARLDSSRQFRAVIACGMDGQPWSRRRDDWQRLLAGDARGDGW